MKIARVFPKPPPEFTMTFTRDEGWAVVMALKDAVRKYPNAQERDQWADDLEKALFDGL